MGVLPVTGDHIEDDCAAGPAEGSLLSTDTGILLRVVCSTSRAPSVVYNRICEHILIINKSQPTGLVLIKLGFRGGLVAAVPFSTGMTEYCATIDGSTFMVMS